MGRGFLDRLLLVRNLLLVVLILALSTTLFLVSTNSGAPPARFEFINHDKGVVMQTADQGEAYRFSGPISVLLPDVEKELGGKGWSESAKDSSHIFLSKTGDTLIVQADPAGGCLVTFTK